MAITFVGSSKTGVRGAQVDLPLISGLADNDYVVIVFIQETDAGSAWAAVSGTDGWTLEDSRITTAGNHGNSSIARKLITDVSSEPTNWQFETTADERNACVALAFRGVNTGDPIDASVTGADGENDLNPDAPDITTGSDNAMVVSFHSAIDNDTVITGSAITGGAPPELTLADDEESDLAWVYSSAAYSVKATAGAFTIGSWTHTPDNATSEWHVRTIALKSAEADIVPALTDSVNVTEAVNPNLIIMPQVEE